MARKQYATIQVSPETKERFLQLGTLGDSQDTVLSKLIDSWDSRGNAVYLSDETLRKFKGLCQVGEPVESMIDKILVYFERGMGGQRDSY